MKHAILAISIAFAASPVRADTVVEYHCVVVAKGPSGKIERILPETKVLEPTQSLQKFSITLPPAYSNAIVQCFRSDLVPAENDWKVLTAGYPLFITEWPSRIDMVLELIGGQIDVEFPGTFKPTQDQLNRLQARVNQLQTSMQDADSAAPVQK